MPFPFGVLFIVLIVLFCLFLLLIWIWTLVDILRSRFDSDTTKLIWVIVIIFLPVLGVILYWIVGREQRQSS
ncbi:phospholipase D-like protein [Thermoflavifilum aggregans]|uniref:Phospholipase D-like protein n=1 Tax=Thermoflavifilum aggregans TaxID=454188 RepID=A0A2M9CVT5_9BACT|nr:PLDc N-terminal domain-containing protein [Thermoflavifilum aggregans]MBX6379411.1 PLDc N-terminal domain-containing protein [Thermoflavifilum aggregans]PJJ76032.1 phospholipase D-like protein [Thermoflavifilum aggregans]